MSQSIEFSTGDDDDSGDIPEELTSSTNGAAKSKENSLEQLLMTRNKKLSNELTVLRVSHRDLQTQIQTLQEESANMKAELEKSQALCATLENDLLRVQRSASAVPSAAMSVAGTYTSRFPSSRRGNTSPTSSIISGFDQGTASANTMEAIRAGEAVGGGSGILPMIQAQRDRFKQKNSQLEEELSKTYATVKTLRQEVASLQKDNLNLYEKTRYVSTYSRGQGSASTSASAYANRPSAASVYASEDASSSGVSLDKYHSAYEAQISPFAAFRGREATRAYKRMSLPERLVFSITRVVLANRTSRNIFAIYCFALHVLLFVMLYSMSAVEIEKHHIDNLAATGAGAAAAGGGVGGSGAAAGTLHGDDWEQEGFT